MDKIVIKGARENNLKNVNLELPKNKLIVMTGVSGSGKSTLAFDTIYAEGQRRYVESLSAYARQFLGGTEKPDVDSIDGLSPSISIDQKTTSKNPRSTVGTVTEIYDYLRLLFARIGVPYCPNHNIPITSQTVDEIVDKVLENEMGTKLIIMSPVAHGEKGTHKDLLESLRKDGYVRVRINGETTDLSEDINLDKNKKDNIDVIVDRIVLKEDVRSRLAESIEQAIRLSHGKVVIDYVGNKEVVYSENFGCPYCDFSLPELEPRMFSFNAPFCACPDCKGLGVKLRIDKELVMPDQTKSLNEGVIKTLNDDPETIEYMELECLCKHYKIDMDKPWNKLSKKEQDLVLYGSTEPIRIKYTTRGGIQRDNSKYYEGVINNLERRYMNTTSSWIRDWLENYMLETVCETCNGARLMDNVLSVKVGNKNIYEVTCMSIKDLVTFFDELKLTTEQEKIAGLLLKEIKSRLDFLKNVGLEYLTLARSAGTLSGGEAQRIRLATQIGSKLSGVLYVLDEPSIGLHQSDNQKLIKSLQEMRDLGNTLIVVEHDTETMLASDYLVDIGPGAGDAGGEVVASGTPEEVMKCENSITGRFLSGKECIATPKKRRKGINKCIEVKGAAENNLKDIDVKFPLGTFTCVTGVSGSGKSTLVNQVLCNAAYSKVYESKVKPGKHKKITGLDNIDKVVEISQNPIGRTPRSNPATYTGVFDDIRELFTTTKDAKMLGFGKDRFSFNVKGGRCEACRGDGVKKIEMHFLPDVYIPCEVCHGTRYNSETLRIRYKGKNIADVLDMRVTEALEFFENVPKLKTKLQVLEDVGIGYLKLGQSAPTLSGGEAGRVKLAKELQKKPTGKTLYIMDEPTTGLHSADIKRLLAIIQKIVDNKDTVIVIEHNLDVIKCADYIIDLGPDGGDNGGTIVATGTPEDISKVKESKTGKFLKEIL